MLLLASLVATALAAPSAKADPHGFYGHAYHGPPCTHVLVEKTKEVCYYEPEKVCETKTSTYKVITGYEKGECKEVEVCKHHGWRRRRSPHGPHLHHHECEKEVKEVCGVVPTVEEKSEEVELCHIEPEKVCEEKEVEVPKLVCEEEEDKEEDTG